MELIEKTPIKIDKKLVSIPLPEKLILYTLDSSHILLAIKPIAREVIHIMQASNKSFRNSSIS